jgi:hypothetical protein
VLATGSVVSDAPTDRPTVLSSVGVFTELVSLYSTYFGGGEGLVAQHVATTADPIRAVRLGMNATYGALAGLVAFRVR